VVAAKADELDAVAIGQFQNRVDAVPRARPSIDVVTEEDHREARGVAVRVDHAHLPVLQGGVRPHDDAERFLGRRSLGHQIESALAVRGVGQALGGDSADTRPGPRHDPAHVGELGLHGHAEVTVVRVPRDDAVGVSQLLEVLRRRERSWLARALRVHRGARDHESKEDERPTDPAPLHGALLEPVAWLDRKAARAASRTVSPAKGPGRSAVGVARKYSHAQTENRGRRERLSSNRSNRTGHYERARRQRGVRAGEDDRHPGLTQVQKKTGREGFPLTPPRPLPTPFPVRDEYRPEYRFVPDETDPRAARFERGDRAVIGYRVRTASGAKYEGQDLSLYRQRSRPTARCDPTCHGRGRY
jgi:hypothetical protein